MITSLKLKCGSGDETHTIDFSPDHVTIFLGPNNGGKSLLLREIEKWCMNGPFNDGKILSDLQIQWPSPESLIEEIRKFELLPEPGETLQNDRIKYGKLDVVSNSRSTHTASIENLKAWANGSDQRGFKNYVSLYVLRLDALARLHLVGERETNDLQRPTTNVLNELFQNDGKRRSLRKILKEAFGRYYVIDPTGINKLRIRFADREPTESEEKSLTQEAIQFYKLQPLISEFSDGVNAFTGLLMATISSSARILLIDEPEAFLHPSLTSRLGLEVSSIMQNRDGNLLAATHSPKFLMGCIESGKKLNIVRLTYDGKSKSTVRLLPNEKIKSLMQQPLLRSVGVLDALFYNYVIVTEADADRAFYQEINHRLNNFKPDWGIQNILFLNAHGKQEIWDIVRPLRELGVPTAAIVDIDIIKNGGQEWNKVLGSAFIPEARLSALQNQRQTIAQKFTDSGKDMKRDGGVDILSNSDRQACIDFFEDLASYGIFVVAKGEIESWLPRLEVSRAKNTWLKTIFEKLGSNPEDSSYVKPSDDDVWEFMSKAKKWLTDFDRKGIPSLSKEM